MRIIKPLQIIRKSKPRTYRTTMECEIETRALYLLDIVVEWLWVKNNGTVIRSDVKICRFLHNAQGTEEAKRKSKHTHAHLASDGRMSEAGKFVCLAWM